MTKVLIIGGGMAGCTAAYFLTKKGYKVELVEAAPFLGGGCKTFNYGGHPFTYGPRHFISPDEKLFEFLNQFVPMRRIPEHEFLTYVESDNSFYHYPIHRDELSLMPDEEQILKELENKKEIKDPANLEEYWIACVGRTLYRKFVDDYSKKMWQVDSNTEIDTFSWSPKGVTLKEGARAAWTEAISGFPLKENGYDDYFDLTTKDATVRLKTRITDFDIENHKVEINGAWEKFDMIISTVSPEIIMKNAFGPLRWVGREFMTVVLPTKEVFPPNVYFLYYANKEPFTRLVEYKKFYRCDESDTTLIGIEIPSFKNKLYPYPIKKDQELAQKYLDALPDKVYSIGRAGSYRYDNIAMVIEQCMKLFEKM